jgi:Flp pilus assembly pilin Flp
MTAKRRRQRGASMVEYAVAIAVIVALGIGLLTAFHGALGRAMERAGLCVMGVGSCNGSASGGDPESSQLAAGLAPADSSALAAVPGATPGEVQQAINASLAFSPGLGALYTPLPGGQTPSAVAIGALDAASAWTQRNAEGAIEAWGATVNDLWARLPLPLKLVAAPFAAQYLLLASEPGQEFLKGVFVTGLGGTVDGILRLLADPKGALEGLGRLALGLLTRPGETVGAIWEKASAWCTGNPARCAGAITFEVLTAILPTKAAKGSAATKLDDLGDAGRVVAATDDVAALRPARYRVGNVEVLDDFDVVPTNLRNVTPSSCYAGVCRGGACFVAGTPVQTERGAQPIEEVQVGDRVLARDPESGEVGYHAVLRTSVKVEREVLTLDVVDGQGAHQILHVTPDHPFFTGGRGLVAAGDLDVERDRLADASQAPLRIAAAFSEPDTTTVYNLEVAEAHTYFVGDLSVWVHNGVCDGGWANHDGALRGVGYDIPRKFQTTAFGPFFRFKPKHPPGPLRDFSDIPLDKLLGEGAAKRADLAQDGSVILRLKNDGAAASKRGLDELLIEKEVLDEIPQVTGLPTAPIEVGRYGDGYAARTPFSIGGNSKDGKIDLSQITPATEEMLRNWRDDIEKSGAGIIDFQFQLYDMSKWPADVPRPTYRGRPLEGIAPLVSDPRNILPKGHPAASAVNGVNLRRIDTYLDRVREAREGVLPVSKLIDLPTGKRPPYPPGIEAEHLSAMERAKRTVVKAGDNAIARNTPRDGMPKKLPDFSDDLTIKRQVGQGWDKVVAFSNEGPVVGFLKDHVPIEKAVAQQEILNDMHRAGYPTTTYQVGLYQGRPVVLDQKYLWGQTRDFVEKADWADGRSLDELTHYRDELVNLRETLRRDGGGGLDFQWSLYPCAENPQGCIKVHDVNNYYRGSSPIGKVLNRQNQGLVNDVLKRVEAEIERRQGSPPLAAGSSLPWEN